MARYDLEGYASEYARRRRGYRAGPWYGPHGRGRTGYGRDYPGGPERYGAEFRGGTYGREFRKSRWQTDYGDPFRDRERGTPIRVIRGRWGGYGDELYGRRRGPGYDYEFEYRRRRYV